MKTFNLWTDTLKRDFDSFFIVLFRWQNGFFFKNLKKFAERNQTTKTENLYLLILLYTLLLYTLIYSVVYSEVSVDKVLCMPIKTY